jgi:hypothetical protein
MSEATVPQFPLTEYREYLQKNAGLGEKATHSYVMALRRFFKHLDEREQRNPQMVVFYRASLSPAMRGMLGSAWAHFQEFGKTQGIEDLPDMPHMPQTRFPHPMYPYVAEIAGKANLSTAAQLRPEEVPESIQDAVEVLALFARLTGQGRVDFITGQRALPWDEWVLKQILRAPDVMSKGSIEKVFLQMLEDLTRISWRQLCEARQEESFLNRLVYFHDQFTRRRADYLRRVNFKRNVEKHLESIRKDDSAGLNWKQHWTSLAALLHAGRLGEDSTKVIQQTFERATVGNQTGFLEPGPVFW